MSERAKQFMPFAALRGYYDLIREGAAVMEPRRILTDEQSALLDETVVRLRRGMLVSIEHYENYCYVITTARIEDLQLPYRSLRLGKKKLSFNDIYAITILQNTEDDGEAFAD